MDHFEEKQALQNGPGSEALSTESLQAMSPAELAEALERALDAIDEENYDPELIDAYLDALDKKAPIPKEPDPEKAFQEFQDRLQSISCCGGASVADKNAPAPVRKRYPVKRVAVTVAATVALLFALMVGAQAAGMNVFGNLAQWTDELFFFIPSVSENPHNSEYHAEFRQALEEQGMPGDLALAWYPKGFTVKKLEAWDNEMGKLVEYCFQNEEGEAFSVSVDKYNVAVNIMSSPYEKDSGDVELYTSNERTFYIMSNVNTVTAAWSEGTLAETIRGQISVAEAKKMIDSMGG